MKSPCQTAITNLKIAIEKYPDPTLSKEELVAIYDAVYDKRYEVMFNGKRYNYKHLLQNLLIRDPFQGLYSNFEAEILDNTTFHYTLDFCQEGMPQSSYKIHEIATVNPNNGKIISMKIMTGQSVKEIIQFNKKYVDVVEKNIEACKTSSLSTGSHNTDNKYVRNVPSSSASPTGLMNKMYNRRSRNSRHLVSRILKRSSTMTSRISTILSREK